MFSETAELYDVVYGQFKNYPDEARAIAAILNEVHPEAERLLDVACGSGEHARILTDEYGYAVDGLDLERGFVEIAQRKSPSGDFYRADMLDFSLAKTYDAILCLFSSIGYACTLENVGRALRQFREHLAPGGVLILEPWFQPAEWEEGRVEAHIAEGEGVKVCRMSHSHVREGVSVLEFHYLIGRAGGVEHRREFHELGLFTMDEMVAALTASRFEIIRHDPVGLIGRGLFVARTMG